jgi:hypothetical protein
MKSELSTLAVLLAFGCGGATGAAFDDGDGAAGPSTTGSGAEVPVPVLSPGSAGSGSLSASGAASGAAGGGSGTGRPAPGQPAAPVTINSTTCGATPCDLTTNDCCIGLGGAGLTCAPTGKCPPGPTIVASCSSAAACPTNEVCCLGIGDDAGTALATASCQSACSAARGGLGAGLQLCSTDAECPAGDTCQSGEVAALQLGIDVCVPALRGGLLGPDGGLGRFNLDAGFEGFDAGLGRFNLDAGFDGLFDGGPRRRRGRDGG